MWLPLYTKVKAAFIAALILGLFSFLDYLGALDLGFLGSWGSFAGAALVALVAYLKGEITAFVGKKGA